MNTVQQILDQAVAERQQDLQLATGEPPQAKEKQGFKMPELHMPQLNWTAVAITGIVAFCACVITNTLTANSPNAMEQKLQELAAQERAKNSEATSLIAVEAMRARPSINICLLGNCPDKGKPNTFLQGEQFSATATNEPPAQPADPTVPVDPIPPAPLAPAPAPGILYASTQQGQALSATPTPSAPALTGDAYYDQWRLYWWTTYQANPNTFKEVPDAFEKPDDTAQRAFWDLYQSL